MVGNLLEGSGIQRTTLVQAKSALRSRKRSPQILGTGGALVGREETRSMHTGPLLRRPAKIVPEKVKVGLVKIIGELLHLILDMKDRESATYQKTYVLLSQLLQSLRSRPGRISLVATFQRLALLDASLAEVAALAEALNAYSAKRTDEPDFDRRLVALGTLNETQHATLSCSQWLPILYNMLNFIQDPVELAVRNSALYAMRRFINLVAAQTSPEYEETFIKVLFPGLKNGLRSKNEQVRFEVLGVIAYSVEKCEQEMRVLLQGGNDKADFFNNVLLSKSVIARGPAEIGRTLRGRSSKEYHHRGHLYLARSELHCLNDDGGPSSGHQCDTGNRSDVAATHAGLVLCAGTKDESERLYVRALVALLDNFHFSMEQEFVPEAPGENPDEDREDADSAEAQAAAARACAPSALAPCSRGKTVAYPRCQVPATLVQRAVDHERVQRELEPRHVARHLQLPALPSGHAMEMCSTNVQIK
ncbi:hypothetical protein HYPSUDRAFT_1080701 [Hypholoma sublateritium FD-334 SS-4]|uniref:U3 small nucleolar RNA-associated protein 20 N-terminal domain-containing protein n=1 Tax=Hypholoma sublateritium (strain FD-334 SS-4) TaxID=945553 RepID=A0A0D2NX91_HYPSF|nr:hypothetical protein HYPSUDRAFT_1080701 [Hypholoma sublateritium FD-334 SS-4]